MIALSGRSAAIRRLIGWGAVVASLGFVGVQLWRHAPWRLAGANCVAAPPAEAEATGAAASSSTISALPCNCTR